ncbi:ribonuclease P protein component [Leifsonia sp. Root112D2]|uniref:ribonuclease P protein component n=1 Tax=Leifsonia sp. Root112D2 TaxID=1736426 RepID=UPI0009E6FEE5|nr:ribonuclease P protein component [Leifsonia sp. Root112D2]
MLAKAHRITQGADYKMVVRRGRRVVLPHTVTYVRQDASGSLVRFGFIVGKSVGNAVHRNRVRRRMKAVCFDLLPEIGPGTDIVVRALPASVDAGWTTLQEEISRAVTRGTSRS